MKKLTAAVLAAVMMLSLAVPALAAGEGMQNFRKVNQYNQLQFKDVSPSAWYASEVKGAYELGLVKGMDQRTFAPDSNITLAETLALACRLNSIYYTGSANFQQGSPWYQVYVDYAKNRGILPAGGFANYNAKATRAQFAQIMAAALPAKVLPAVNNVTKLPDVSMSDACYLSVLRLYQAGILTGNDEYGTFAPNSNITRCQVAAIVNRMADTSVRKHFVLQNFEGIEVVMTGAEFGRLYGGCWVNMDTFVNMGSFVNFEFYQITGDTMTYGVCPGEWGRKGTIQSVSKKNDVCYLQVYYPADNRFGEYFPAATAWYSVKVQKNALQFLSGHESWMGTASSSQVWKNLGKDLETVLSIYS